jgi:phage terminase large subunit-like protein
VNLSRAEKIELISLLEERERRNKALSEWRRLYPWQREFVEATAQYHESCLMAANQVGKSSTGRLIDAFHLTGDYPEDWKGHRFKVAPLCWMLGYSMEKTRDLLQEHLFGRLDGGKLTGGLVPANRIIGHESASGVPGAVRTVYVKHISGAQSVAQFWSYSQGQHAIMGDVVDWFHVDEEPRDQTIRPQLLTRTINGGNGEGGRGIYTFTPENGRTELVVQFMDSPSPSQFFMRKGWADATHITPEKANRLLESFPVHQRQMRSEGVPMLGHGRIYDLSEDFITCDPFDIPDHWFVIDGMDFGDDHPQAHVQLVEDRDNGIFYLTHSYKARRTSANDAWGAVKFWAEKVPTAWPQDGLQGEKGRDDARQLKNHYETAGFNMLHDFATWPDGGRSVETGLFEIKNLMQKGLFKVFKGNRPFLDEFLQYHRDERGHIVKTNDDAADAVRYAYMMRRFAVRRGDIGKAQTVKINFAGWQ